MRITQKAIASIIILQTLGSVVLGMASYTNGSKELRSDFALRVESVVQAIAHSTSLLFCLENGAVTQHNKVNFLKKIAESGGLSYIVIRQGEEVLAQWGQTQAVASQRDDLSSDIRKRIESDRLYTAYAEVPACETFPSSEAREIEVGVSFAVLDRSLSNLLDGIFYNLAGVVILGVVIGYFLGKLITRKVNSIHGLLQQISNSEFRAVGPVKVSNDEFGIIEGEIFKTGARLLALNAEKEKQRADLASASKLSSLGEMAGGVAHEINNPLGIISGRLEQMRRVAEKDPIDREKILSLIVKSEDTLQRIVKIIRGLRLFSRNADNDPKINYSLKSIVEDTLGICAERFRAAAFEVRLKIECDQLVICRPTQISQVIINLLGNSFDACQARPNPWIEISILPLPKKVQLRITDCGEGIPPAVADKIFSPFYTTKEVGKGTGLGLSVSKGIIEEHEGVFFLDQNAKNTSFVIELPV